MGSGDPDPRDAESVHCQDLEAAAADDRRVADAGDALEAQQQVAGQGFVRPRREGYAAGALELGGGDEAGDQD